MQGWPHFRPQDLVRHVVEVWRQLINRGTDREFCYGNSEAPKGDLQILSDIREL